MVSEYTLGRTVKCSTNGESFAFNGEKVTLRVEWPCWKIQGQFIFSPGDLHTGTIKGCKTAGQICIGMLVGFDYKTLILDPDDKYKC
jgi:hypothetical protein